MAPDLNALSSGERWDYSTPGSSGYNVPNMVYNDPSTRKIKVLTVGAGFAGIQLAYQIQKYTENVEHIIYEKNPDVGGTWLENRYPGCACDVPAPAYVYNFAPNPDWPRFFAYSQEIHEYLKKVCDVFDLRKYMTFNTEVIGSEWQDDTGKWKVTLRQKTAAGAEKIFEEECDLLLFASGILNHHKLPNAKGIEKFRGRVVHSADWPQDYQSEQWRNERVAVIGSGASSIQIVPNLQPYVKHMDIFVRTAVWFIQFGDGAPNKEFSEEERAEFRRDPRKLVALAKDIEHDINGMWDIFYSGSEAQKKIQDKFRERMKKFIKDERLLNGFAPKFELGCRRVTPGDPYMKAIQEPNVDVHFTAVDEITETGVIGADGVEREVDTIICATGFDVSYLPRFPVIGKNGVSLSDKWKNEPKSYLGLACPDMPNWMVFVGPTWPIENGSVTGSLKAVGLYAINIIKKMQREHIKSWVPRQDTTDEFNDHVQEWIKHTVWKDDCRSWYKNNDTGRVNAVWPGSSNHYAEVLETPRYEDFEFEYLHKNLWAQLGMGYSMCNAKYPNSDVSPYLQVENVDPKWLKAIGYEGPEGEFQKMKEYKWEPIEQRKGEDAKVGQENGKTLA